MTTTPEPHRPGWAYPILLVGVSSFALSAILVRMADEGPGQAVAAWRTLFAVLLLTPFAARRFGPEVRRFSGRDWRLVIGAGVLLGLHFVTWIESLYHTSVASSSVLVTSSPIFLAVLGFLFLGERLRRKEAAAIVLAVSGAALIGLGDASDSAAPRALFGNSLALTAALLVSLYMLIGRVVRRKTSWTAYVFPLYTVVALTTWAAAVLSGTPLLGYSWSFYGWCLLMALGPQIIGHGSVNYALRFFPAALIGLLTLLEPVGASVLAFLLFGERPTLMALIGILVVLASVVFTVLPYPALPGGRRSRPELPKNTTT